ncbi:alpha/beta fold hydrolase [Hymenobacter negativus]|uniref:Alpha/beta fold hydrolase n=1 Tax=Hymenobacter negativus TaxID=2795026 RepID=A0ABS3QF75_9BACT|nr:alpha/beta fold hydrolase [Hymenobacter negativus]MBO2009648.1 alpha/beta fold hydrolase [Hymenobacter negativus]
MATPYAPKQLTTHGQTVALGNLELYYEEYGVGKPLVLLHGFGGCTQNWRPFIPELAERHRLLVVDLRGHGYSTNPEHTFTHRDAAQDVFRLLDHLGIERCSAMGMSSGGMTLLHMATSQPTRIDTMVLISATTHFPAQARAIMRAASFRTMPPPVQEMYRECAKRGDEQIQELLLQFNTLADNYDDMDFTQEHLGAITARTLVAHGDRDRFFPVDIPVTIYRSIRNAALWIIPGGDHVPVYEATVPFMATALQFLAGSNRL